MFLNIGICDNNSSDLLSIKKLLEQYEMNYDIDFKLLEYENGNDLLNDIKKNPNIFHLIFLDISMPQLNGLEVAQYIRKDLKNYKMQIVFISNYPEYMQDSFNVQAFHFICKPFSFTAIENVISHVIDYYNYSQSTRLILHENGTEEFVDLDDILYFKVENSQKRILSVVLTSKSCQIKGRLTKWQKDLRSLNFVSPCREYLVNLRHVHFTTDSSIVLDTGKTIPLSRRKHKEISERFNQSLIHFAGNR